MTLYCLREPMVVESCKRYHDDKWGTLTLTLTQLSPSHIGLVADGMVVSGCFVATGVFVSGDADWVAVGCTLGCSWVAVGLHWVAVGLQLGCTMGGSMILPLCVNIFLFFLPIYYLRHI